MRTALLAHRDSALVVSGNRPTGSSLAGIERQLEALAGAGFSSGDGLLALLTLNAYVLGDVLDLQAEDGRAPSGHDAGPAVGSFPLLRAAAGVLSSPGGRFEHGLGILIDGLRARRAG
jgi:TetR/AcrR family transcriptional regulator, tetracycline repressor protein